MPGYPNSADGSFQLDYISFFFCHPFAIHASEMPCLYAVEVLTPKDEISPQLPVSICCRTAVI
jgi:hypothetical protein